MARQLRANDRFWNLVADGKEFRVPGEEPFSLTEDVIRDIIANKEDHYTDYRIPKASGGFRTLMAPSERLKAIQRLMMKRLDPFGKYDSTHGFVKGKDIRTNAAEHRNASFLLHTDITAFFPSITSDIIRECIRHRPQLRTWIGDHEDEFIELVTRNNQAPQGAPTSPVIGNIVMRPIDKSIKNYLVNGVGLTYTRYADKPDR